MNSIPKETKLHVRLWACTLLQLNTLLWDILFWTGRVLRTSQNRVSSLLTQGDMYFLHYLNKNHHIQLTHELGEDDDDKPLVLKDLSIVYEDEDDEPLVQPSSKTVDKRKA